MGNYPIGFWNVLELEQSGPECVEHWHDLGITQPMSPTFTQGGNKQAMLDILDKADAYGMRTIICDYRTGWQVLVTQGEEAYRNYFSLALQDFGTHPAVMGFYAGDEPNAKSATDAFKAVRIQREMAPHLIPYLNLPPWFDLKSEQEGIPSLPLFHDRAVNEGVSLLSFDCYTQMLEGEQGWDDYFDNLREHMMSSHRLHVPFQAILLSCGHYYYRCPNEDDMRWQLTTAVAHGASGISWFFINLPAVWDNYRQAPIDQFGNRTQAFGWLSTTNRLFQALCGNIMADLKIVSCYHVHKSYGGMPLFESNGKVETVFSENKSPLIFSEFRDSNGGLYWIVVNNSVKASIQATIRFTTGTHLEKCNFGNVFAPVPIHTDPIGKRIGEGDETVNLWLAPGQLTLLREAK